MLKFLKGRRTYVVCVVAIIWAIGGLALGYLSSDETVNIVLASLAAAGLRAGIK